MKSRMIAAPVITITIAVVAAAAAAGTRVFVIHCLLFFGSVHDDVATAPIGVAPRKEPTTTATTTVE